MAKILIVDDQPMVLKCLKSALTADGHDIATVSAGDLALKLVGFQSFDVIITDYAMPGMDGIKFLDIARQRSPGVPIIMITGYGTADTAMEAMQKGAFDYLAKPFSLESLRSTVGAALEFIKARNSIPALGKFEPSQMPFPNIVAASAAMTQICSAVSDLSNKDNAVLIQGESGLGKELLARTVHAIGPRKEESFDRIDCRKLKDGAALGDLLAYSKAATIFFKEISALPASMQKELVGIFLSLRFLSPEKSNPIPLKIRILASTSVPLQHLVDDGRFNNELLQVLKDTTLTIPPLRERVEDLQVHLGLTLRQLGAVTGDIPIEPETLLMLEKYPWPGNLPEVEETLRNAITMAGGGKIGIQHLPREIVRIATIEGREQMQKVDLKQFRGRVVKSFLHNMKQEYETLIDKIESFSE